MKILSSSQVPTPARALLYLAVCLLAGPVLAAGPLYWDWPAGRSFDELDLNGTALNARGEVVTGLLATDIPVPGPEVIWSIVADGKNGYFLGTGHSGEIHWTDGDDQVRLHARLEGNEVFSLLPRPGGGLLAGCGPEGQVHEVNSDGTSRLLGQIDGGYVWAMHNAPKGEDVWLATGSPAALYRWRPGERLTSVATFPALNALDIAVDHDGTLLVATQGPGLVYRVDPRGKTAPRLLFEAAQDEIRQFISGPDGALHFLALRTEAGENRPAAEGEDPGGSLEDLVGLFGTKPDTPTDKAALFRLGSNDDVRSVWAGNADLMIVAWSDAHGWLGGGTLADDRSRLLKLTPPFGSYPVGAWQGGDILDVHLAQTGPAAGDVLVAQAHPGAVSRLGANGAGPRLALSPPLDGHQVVKWGRLSWRGELAGQKLKWSVRGGNSSTPDTTWSAWSGTWTDRDHPLTQAPSRYLQWRVEFRGAPAAEAASLLQSVSVSAWQDNRAPVIRAFNLEQVTAMERGGLMSHSDNITQTFRSGLKAEFSRSSQVQRRPQASRAAETRPVRVFTWQGYDPNGDRLDYTLEYRSLAGDSWRPIGDPTPEQIGSWNTAEVADGTYEVRLTASDRAENPGARALATSRLSPHIRVDNTPPEISAFKISRTETGLRIRFRARDEATPLAGALVTLPEGEALRLDPVDLICDSRQEEFDVDLPWPTPPAAAPHGPWQVHVEVRDMGGNLAVAEGDAR